MEVCPNCDYENEANTTICTRCGDLLIPPVGTAIINTDESEVESSPKYGSVRFGDELKLNVLDGDTEFTFDGDDITELIIGRKDPETGLLPQIDLTPERASKMGVSRNHAMIVQLDGTLHIRDNGSSNGTFLNGQRLIEDKMRVLRDGDDIQVGKIVLRVTFV